MNLGIIKIQILCYYLCFFYYYLAKKTKSKKVIEPVDDDIFASSSVISSAPVSEDVSYIWTEYMYTALVGMSEIPHIWFQ